MALSILLRLLGPTPGGSCFHDLEVEMQTLWEHEPYLGTLNILIHIIPKVHLLEKSFFHLQTFKHCYGSSLFECLFFSYLNVASVTIWSYMLKLASVHICVPLK